MKLLLVDGHYYLYRSYYAIRGLTNDRGEPTNAIFGFCKALRKMLEDLGPSHAAVIWDSGLPAHRMELQPEYKQNRGEMPDDLRPQEEWLQQHISKWGPASLSVPGTEADDLIASYARAAETVGAETIIATNDKDIFQLAGDKIHFYAPSKASEGGYSLLGADDVVEKWGLPPERLGQLLALTGDSSDNIPGVPGIGPKTAAKLLHEFGSLDALFASLDQLKPGKTRDVLEKSHDLVRLNLQMVTLHDALDLPVPLTALTISPDYASLLPELRLCGFRTMVREVETLLPAGSRPSVQGELFSG